MLISKSPPGAVNGKALLLGEQMDDQTHVTLEQDLCDDIPMFDGCQQRPSMHDMSVAVGQN